MAGAEKGIAVALQWICFGLSFVSFAFYAYKVIHVTRVPSFLQPFRPQFAIAGTLTLERFSCRSIIRQETLG